MNSSRNVTMPKASSSIYAASNCGLVLAAAIGLASCATPNAGADGLYAKPTGNAPVTSNPTPYTASLQCLADYALTHHVRAAHIAVGRINDMTGQLDQNGGRPVTQGAMLMAISALGKAGVPLVERYETDVSKLEYKLADSKLIRDGETDEGLPDYEAILPGQISGAEYFLTGGITELNTNIESAGLGQGPSPYSGVSANSVVMNIGLDLRLINTKSTDIVDIVSFQKQIIGTQVGAGVYAFLGGNPVNLNLNRSTQEPVHFAIRTLIERAVVDMVTKLYDAPPGTCIDPANDPIGEPTRANFVARAVTEPPARLAEPAPPIVRAASPPPAARAAVASLPAAPVASNRPVASLPAAPAASNRPAGLLWWPSREN